MISTAERTVRYTKEAAAGEEREITVRSSDGFTFPVDVRIEYRITPRHAPLVVAKFGDDGAQLLKRLTSAVRAIFRNNAESVKALDYVQQRSTQETQSREMLATAMSEVGVTVTAVRIGDVGDEETLGLLLKTQTDREIAIQEQKTFQEQQRTAEQKKELSKTEQEAEEERRLATASYEVRIAEQDKERKVIEAKAEAEAIQIRAQAQADAYKLIAEQIGKGNAALLELLKVIGERGIEITPRVMVSGAGSGPSAQDAETTALIGTMLDSMVSRERPSTDD
jgi:regulator of protease activity HflC (stomatin/prohibitin superfamily)